MLAPALGQHVFFLRFQHGEPTDLLKVVGKTAFGGNNRQSRSTGHCSALQMFAPVSGGRSAPSLPEPTVRHVATVKPRSRLQHTEPSGAKGRGSPITPACWSICRRLRITHCKYRKSRPSASAIT